MGGRVCGHYRSRILYRCSSRTCERFQAENRRWDYSGVGYAYSGGADDRNVGDQLGGRHGYRCTGRYNDDRSFTGGGGGRCTIGIPIPTVSGGSRGAIIWVHWSAL